MLRARRNQWLRRQRWSYIGSVHMLHTLILMCVWRVSKQASHRVVDQDQMNQEG